MSSLYRPPFAVAARPIRLVFAPPFPLIESQPEPADSQFTVGKGTTGVSLRLATPRATPSLGKDSRFADVAAATLAPTGAMTLLVRPCSVSTPCCMCAD